MNPDETANHMIQKYAISKSCGL